MMNTITKWKDCVGAGWIPLVEQAIDEIESKGGFILQIKEKFGGLRIYTAGGDFDAIDTIVRDAEQKAAVMCETCGQPGKIRTERYWLKTLCEKCNNEKI